MNFDLPSLPDGWQYQKLEKCVKPNSITYGVVQPGVPVEDGVPMIRVNNFRDTHIDTADIIKIEPEIESKYNRTRLSGGEVLLTLVGSVGQVSVVSNKFSGFNVARAIGVIHPLPEISSAWIAICLRSPLSQHLLTSRANTTVQTTINLKDVRALPIPIPPEIERNQISDFVLALDDRITLLRETNATLEAIAQAIFKSWFVDFDPVRAKMEGRAPEGMDEATAALFPDCFEESELGLMPRGWRVGTLGDIAHIARRQIQASDLHADIHYVGLEHMPRKSLSLTSWGNAKGLESAKTAFCEGDVLFGKLRPYFHKVVIAPFAGVCSTDILVCQPSTADYFGAVAMHLFSEALIEYADRLSNGAKMPRVNWKDLAAYPICVPQQQVAARLNDALCPMVSRMNANVHQAHTLATLRDTLLPRLISGQLRLPDADNAIAEAIA